LEGIYFYYMLSAGFVGQKGGEEDVIFCLIKDGIFFPPFIVDRYRHRAQKIVRIHKHSIQIYTRRIFSNWCKFYTLFVLFFHVDCASFTCWLWHFYTWFVLFLHVDCAIFSRCLCPFYTLIASVLHVNCAIFTRCLCRFYTLVVPFFSRCLCHFHTLILPYLRVHCAIFPLWFWHFYTLFGPFLQFYSAMFTCWLCHFYTWIVPFLHLNMLFLHFDSAVVCAVFTLLLCHVHTLTVPFLCPDCSSVSAISFEWSLLQR
jgi:hypothetical protein